MIALPSIAFGGFSGSAKGVTARQVGGRSILSVRSWPTGQTTSAQVVRRASLSKITKSYKTLTDSQMKDWERLAEHTSGQSVFGQKAQLTGINLYVRLNANRVMAGEVMITDAPIAVVAVPNVSYSNVEITPQLVIFGGIKHEPSPYKLVVKMSGSQSSGASLPASPTAGARPSSSAPTRRMTGAKRTSRSSISRRLGWSRRPAGTPSLAPPRPATAPL